MNNRKLTVVAVLLALSSIVLVVAITSRLQADNPQLQIDKMCAHGQLDYMFVAHRHYELTERLGWLNRSAPPADYDGTHLEDAQVAIDEMGDKLAKADGELDVLWRQAGEVGRALAERKPVLVAAIMASAELHYILLLHYLGQAGEFDATAKGLLDAYDELLHPSDGGGGGGGGGGDDDFGGGVK